MIKYKYRISAKPDQEFWVCETCKKGKSELILTGKWKLIDRCGDSGIPCAICEDDKVTAKNET